MNLTIQPNYYSKKSSSKNLITDNVSQQRHTNLNKTTLNKDTISFSGFDSRLQSKRNSYVWGKIGWWWSGEDKAIEEVSREMRNEISDWQRSTTVKRVELNGLERTLSSLESSNSSTRSAKRSELTALKNAEKTSKETITNLNKTLSAKDGLIKETNNANIKFNNILYGQKQEITNLESQNSDLKKEINEILAKHAARLETDLKTQAEEMARAHDAEMELMTEKINGSIRNRNSIHRFMNIQRPDGLSRIAGYQEQKNSLITHFGTPVAYEKFGKPAEVPNGVLLFGPKGNGKSTFAESMAKQFECNFVEVPNTLNPKVDMQNLRLAATEAQSNFEKSGRRTVLFIKEFDEFAPKGSRITGAMKGFMDSCSKDYHCTVFATTTHPENLDDILLRNRRFDIKVGIPPANKDNAIAILRHYTKGFSDKLVNYNKLAEQIFNSSDGAFSNAQIKAVIQSINPEAIMQNIKALGPDLVKEAIELFKHQIEQVKHL